MPIPATRTKAESAQAVPTQRSDTALAARITTTSQRTGSAQFRILLARRLAQRENLSVCCVKSW